MTILQRERQGGPLLAIDAGDTLYPPAKRRTRAPEDLEKRAAFIREVYAKAEFDAVVPGELDVYPTLDALVEFGKSVPMIAANMVDAETGASIFPASRVVEHAGMKIGLVGVLGPKAFAGTPANVDFDAKIWAEQQSNGGAAARKMRMAKLREQMAQAAKDDKGKAQAEEILKVIQGEGGEDAGEDVAPTPPEYSGRKFRITDGVAAAKAEAAKLAGKADLIVVIGHMEKDETDAFRAAVPEIPFMIDGHTESKSMFASGQNETGPPNILRAGNRGRALSLVTIRINNGVMTFQDRGNRERDESTLKRQKNLWEKLVQQAGGKDPLAEFPKDDPRFKRAERTKALIAETEAKLKQKTGESWFETKTIGLDPGVEGDPELRAREDELDPPASRGH
ncbi:MAG: hypothetical protein IT350_18185 [Deltaproteobacteria bacterium]|nr:hypothetical protein [Deltaproteobacteria bacterium]